VHETNQVELLRLVHTGDNCRASRWQIVLSPFSATTICRGNGDIIVASHWQCGRAITV